MQKLIHVYILVFTLLLGVTSCYEDEGNYSYKESTLPTISGIPESCDAYFGDPLSIPVTINYPHEEWKNVSYEWRVNLKVISTEKDLNLENVNLDIKTNQRADFKVINNDTGEYSMTTFILNIKTEFATGWLILSAGDNSSILSYIRDDDEIYDNIYETLNEEKLAAGAVQINEHWLPWGADMGEIFVGVPNGPNYAVELDGNSLKRMVYSKDEFLEKEPDNFAPVAFNSVMNWDYMISNGKLYTRYVESGLDAKYHEGRFVRIPVPGDYELSPITMRGNLVFSNDIIAFDNLHKSWKVIRNGEIKDFDYKNDANKAFNPSNMNKTLLAGAATSIVNTPTDEFIAFLKDENNQIWVQSFRFRGWGNKTYTSLTENVFPNPELITEDTKWAICLERPYTYFTHGNQLFAYNHEANTVKELKGTTFSRPIKAIAINHASRGEELAVAVENENDPNKCDFMRLNVGVVADGATIEGSHQTAALGKVYYMIYKIGDQWSISQ